MGQLLTMLTRFVGAAGKAFKVGGNLHQVFATMFRTVRLGVGIFGALASVIGGAFLSVMGEVAGVFTDMIKKTIGFNLSFSGLLEQAEKARAFYSQLRDEMNYFSDSQGNATEGMQILLKATGKSKASLASLKSIMQSMVDAGADEKKVLEDLVSEIGDLEVKTGVAGSSFGQMAIKFQQLFKKEGVQKDVLALQKAIVGTGLRTANLEQLMQGLTETTEKLAGATRGETLDFMNLGKEYSKAVGVFKAFGISAQSSTTFFNNLMDPESIDKNMLLLNKLGYSYQEFNDMLNSGKGQEVFFDKIINNIGKVASEANLIEDAQTRYKYLKETLGLPPEFANKLMNVEPYKMREKLKEMKKEMQEAEKQAKYKKQLKEREEKYEERLDFIRFKMVAPLLDLVYKNRGTMEKFAKAMVPIIQGISSLVAKFLTPFSEWLDAFSDGVDKITKENPSGLMDFVTDSLKGLWKTIKVSFQEAWYSEEVQGIIKPFIEVIGDKLSAGIKYAVYKATFRDITFKEAEEKVAEEEKARMKKNLDEVEFYKPKRLLQKLDTDTPGYIMMGTQKDELRSLRSDIKNKIFLYDSDLMTKEEMEKYIKSLENLKMKENQYNPFASGYYKETVDLVKNILNENDDKYLQAIEMVKTSQGKYDLKEALELIEKRLEIKKDREDLNRNLDDMRKGGTYAVAEKITKKIVADIESGKPIAAKTLEQYLATISKDEKLGKFFADTFASKATADLDAIKEQLAQKNQIIDKLHTQFNDLQARFDQISGENPMLKLLEQIKIGVVGNADAYPEFSIKDMLFNIEDALTEDFQGNASKYKGNKQDTNTFSTATKNASTAVDPLLMTNINSYTSPALSDRSKLIQLASGDKVKNLQTRQTLFLKSIAESTYESARYLRYIGNNIVFTPQGGLLVEYTTTVISEELKRKGRKGRNLLDQEAGTDDYLFNFEKKA